MSDGKVHRRGNPRKCGKGKVVDLNLTRSSKTVLTAKVRRRGPGVLRRKFFRTLASQYSGHNCIAKHTMKWPDASQNLCAM